jgi:hypothetical protein
MAAEDGLAYWAFSANNYHFWVLGESLTIQFTCSLGVQISIVSDPFLYAELLTTLDTSTNSGSATGPVSRTRILLEKPGLLEAVSVDDQ